MVPHSLDTILVQPTWPAALSDFVTWCLMWDPKNRPTSTQALQHEYFRDAVDPLIRPKSSSKLLGRKHSNLSVLDNKENDGLPSLSNKTSSWFRRSLVQREISAPAVTQHAAPPVQPASANPPPLQTTPMEPTPLKVRPNANKRATWANGVSSAAPIPILPSIRPVSPLVSDNVNAQATVQRSQQHKKASLKEAHRHEAERALSGQSGLTSPSGSSKEGFFSHLRKRARRFSGRYQTPISPTEDSHSNVSSSHWTSNRHSQPLSSTAPLGGNYIDLEKQLKSVRSSLENDANAKSGAQKHTPAYTNNGMLKRHHSTGSKDRSAPAPRNRKTANKQSHSNLHYDTPDEEDELLDEALASARRAASNLDHAGKARGQYNSMLTPDQQMTDAAHSYLTPSSSANRNTIAYGHTDYQSKPLVSHSAMPGQQQQQWHTPPYENDKKNAMNDPWNNTGSDWASSTMGTIFAASKMYG